MTARKSSYRSLTSLERDLSRCRACVEAGYALESLPVRVPGAGQRAYLFGQAPGVVEGAERLPWRGRAGRTLRRWLELEEEQLCPVPVRSRYGFHVLRVERRVKGRTLPFETVHKKIADYLEDRVWRQAIRQYIELLIGAADIRGIDLKGSASPLVQ